MELWHTLNQLKVLNKAYREAMKAPLTQEITHVYGFQLTEREVYNHIFAGHNRNKQSSNKFI